MTFLAFLREGKFCWWEKQKVSSIFWVESVGESFSTVVFWRGEWQYLSFGSHHLHTRIIFGGGKHAEFSLLTVNLPRLHMLFLLPHHLFSPLIWRLYCLGVDNKGHTWLLLIGYEWFRNFLTEFGIFYQPAEPVGNRFNRFSTIAGCLCQPWGTHTFLCLVLTHPGSELRTCGPSPDPPNRRDSLLKENKEMKKLVFSSFEKPAPGEERCCLESPLTFYFLFLNGEN